MASPFSKFPPTKIICVSKTGEVSERMSRIPAIVQHCWAWLLDPDPAAGSTFRRVFVDCYHGYDVDKSDVRWSMEIDLRILNEFQQLNASHTVSLSHHPTMKNNEIAAFVVDRSQAEDPIIHFTPYYHDLIELLDKVIKSGDGVLVRLPIWKFLSLVITSCTLWLKWKEKKTHPEKIEVTKFMEKGQSHSEHNMVRRCYRSFTPQRIFGRNWTKKKPGKGEGGEAIEDILVGGLAYLTRQTGSFCYRLILLQTQDLLTGRRAIQSAQWYALSDEAISNIVDCLAAHGHVVMPFLRRATTTPIIPQCEGKASFPAGRTARLEDFPPLKPDPRDPPRNSVATPASPLAKFGTLASSNSFSALKAEPLQPPIFCATNNLDTTEKLLDAFKNFQCSDRSGCLVDPEDEQHIPSVPQKAIETKILHFMPCYS